MFNNYLLFVSAHKQLLAFLAALGVIVYVGTHWIDRNYDSTVARNNQAQAVLQQQVSTNKEIAEKVDSLNQQYQALLGQVTAQNQELAKAILARNQAVVVQQKTDATLPLNDLAARQNTLAGTTGVTSTETGLSESPASAVVITQKLETLPVLTQNVADQQTEMANKDKQITGLNGVVTGLNGQVSGLNAQLTDAGKACNTQLNEVKAAARKSKRNWFVGGLATAGAIALGIALHI